MVTGNEIGTSSVVNSNIVLSVVQKFTASVENICSGESVVPKSSNISAVVGGKSAPVGVVSNMISNGIVVSKSSGGSGVVSSGNSSAWRVTTAAFKLAAKSGQLHVYSLSVRKFCVRLDLCVSV